MKNRAFVTMLVVLLLASMMAVAASVSAQPLDVWVPTQYATIQDGVNAVAEGGTVHVKPGTYYEHVSINKPLTLAGTILRKCIIDGSGVGTVVGVTDTQGVKISGFTIQHGGTSFPEAGILLWNADRSKLANLDVRSNGGYGIFTQYSEYVVIADVNTHSNGAEGIALGQSPSHSIIRGVNSYSNLQGITVYDGPTNVTIKDCNVYSNTQNGIILGWTSNGLVSNCRAWSNGFTGINLEASSSSTVENCISKSNGYHGIGIAVCWGGNTITCSQAFNNQYSGLYLGAADGCTIEKCVSSFNGEGISLWDGFWGIVGRNNVITENVVSKNGVGMRINAPCQYNSIYHNKFLSNKNQALDDGVGNLWDNGYPSGGNYWSDYNGRDRYSGPGQNLPGRDGIGDISYVILGTAGSTDRYPLIRFCWR